MRSPRTQNLSNTMNISIDFDQEQRAASYEAIEGIYLQGFRDGFEGWLPVMSEIIYLQGYGKGMEEGRETVKLSICVPPKQLQSEMFKAQTESPLLCGQCQWLNNGKCAIKSVTRNSSQYACDRVVVDSPF